MKKIITIDMENAETGMQLASDVIDKLGVCLLPIGSVLTIGVIDGLKKRNIQQISIYENITLSPEQALEIKAGIKKELDLKFKYLVDFPAMIQLKQVFFNFRVKNIDTDND